jgi:aryl-alcohol dehydrogenase-like predicted oxidoreductase
MAQGEDVVPIAGTRSPSRIEENAAAADLVLTAEDLARLDAVVPIGITAGDRYADMSSING